MKRLKCKLCSEVWYVNDDKLNVQKLCPFCGESIKQEIQFDNIDSFDKAIYAAVKVAGVDILKTPLKLSACMMDIAPNFKKEIRIISRNITSEYAKDIFEVFNGSINDVESVFIRLKQFLTGEECLSENWADIICNGFKSASLMMRGINPFAKLSVEVNDVADITEKSSKSYDYWELLKKLKALKSWT